MDKNKETNVNYPTSEFSDRYLAQVEAERQYVVHQLAGVEGEGEDRERKTPGIGVPLISKLASMPTVEEAYLSVFAENRSRAYRLLNPAR